MTEMGFPVSVILILGSATVNAVPFFRSAGLDDPFLIRGQLGITPWNVSQAGQGLSVTVQVERVLFSRSTMSEPTVVQCPSCGARYRVEPDKLGKTFTCAKCQQPFEAVAAMAGEPVAPVYSGAMPPQPPPSVGYATPFQPPPAPAGKTSGLAIGSLICGIFGCLWPFTPAAAIVLGIMGINQTSKQNRPGKGLAIAGTVLGGIALLIGPILLLLISILLPSLNKAREIANRAKCASNMHQIGLAILMYQNDNQQQYPPDLTTLLKKEPLSTSVFVCPASSDTPAPSPSQLESGGHLSYVYVPPADVNPSATTVVLYENPGAHGNDGTNVLFGDGHVEWENAAQEKLLIDPLKK
jgi:predicted Zn finger-like uncharacterized protein/prepilin-type processing-associated H-X9-DG protein